MPQPFEHVQTRQPFKPFRVEQNAFIDAAKAHRGNKFNQNPPEVAADNYRVRVWVRNDTGGLVGRYGILGLSEALFDPDNYPTGFQDEIALKGVTPAEEHRGRFAVTQEPINPGKLGRALISGVTQVRIGDGDQQYPYCDLRLGSTLALDGAYGGGARILWQKNIAGDAWGFVRLGDPGGIVRGKTNGTHAKGASGAISVYIGDTDTGHDLMAINDFGDLGANKKVIAELIAGLWYLVAGDCSS